MHQIQKPEIEVVKSVLFDVHPPTNPAVLLHAAREWYLEFGQDVVFNYVLFWTAYGVAHRVAAGSSLEADADEICRRAGRDHAGGL